MRPDRWALTLFVALSLTAPSVRAHTGEFLRELVLHPTDPAVFAIRYESAYGGVLFSRDGGKSVRVVPGQTFLRYDLKPPVPMTMASDGKLLLALDEELRVDDGTGCALTHVEARVEHSVIMDIAQHPSDLQTTFLVTRGSTSEDGAPTHIGLWRRDAQGLTPIGASDAPGTSLTLPPFLPTSFRVIARAASVQGLRFVEVGQVSHSTGAVAMYSPVLRVSDDLGTTWTTHPIPAREVSGNPRLLVVTDSDPFRALIAFDDGANDPDANPGLDPNDPIYLTKDGGQTFALHLDQIQVAAEAVRLPGGRVLLSDRGIPGGLWSAADIEAQPTKIQELRVHCLAYQAVTQKLFMCTRHELGMYDLASNAFCSMFQLPELRGFVSCPAAPLEQNKQAKEQVCAGFCTALHYASAPLCSSFDVGNAALCGAAALAYDREATYVAPPAAAAAPRCSGFPGLVDAGSANPSDGGTDAGVAWEPTPDASAADDGAESGDEESVDAEADDDPEPDAGDLATRQPGCACHVGAAQTAPARAAPLLALGAWLTWRLRRRRGRLERGS